MPRRKSEHSPDLEVFVPVRKEDIKDRIAKLRQIKEEYCRQHRMAWDDCQLPASELAKMGALSSRPMTGKQLAVLDAAYSVANSRGEVTIARIMRAMGLNARDRATSNAISSRIHLMRAHKNFPFKTVGAKEWSKP